MHRVKCWLCSAELWRSCWSTAPAQNWVSLSSGWNVHYSQPLGFLWPLCSPEGDATGTPHPLQPRLFWATIPNMGTSRWTPGLPLRMAGEAPKGVASGRGYSALVTRLQAQGSSSPSHPSFPESWDIPWETQPSRSRHKEGDFSFFLCLGIRNQAFNNDSNQEIWVANLQGRKMYLLQHRGRGT